SDVMKIDPSGEEDHEKEEAHDFAVLLVERVTNGFDKFFRDGGFEPWRDGHNQKGQSTNPHNTRQQVYPVIQNGENSIEIEENFLEGTH
ncbi:MAG: hypothetical protein ACE1ZO_00700, partial [Nitrospirales bacterium]